jgi:hypothetical protein
VLTASPAKQNTYTQFFCHVRLDSSGLDNLRTSWQVA